jgi:pyruvate formate lyase activating enzyme
VLSFSTAGCNLACREVGVKTVAVTAGYICDEPRRELFSHLDAANVDLKAFTEGFYRHVCAGRLQPVLDTLRYLRHETDVWFEITNLLIPDHNDSEDEVDDMTSWVIDNLDRTFLCTSPPFTPTSRCETSLPPHRPR